MALAPEKEDELQKSVSVQEEVLVGSEQERLLLLTSMLGVAEHELISTQDRLNAMQQLQTERDQELQEKEDQMCRLREENERFRKQLREISRVVSAYASNRVARDDETKSELKELKAAHQKRLNRTFESNYAERQYYSSFSGEQVDLEEARIDNDAESE